MPAAPRQTPGRPKARAPVIAASAMRAWGCTQEGPHGRPARASVAAVNKDEDRPCHCEWTLHGAHERPMSTETAATVLLWHVDVNYRVKFSILIDLPHDSAQHTPDFDAVHVP